MGSDLEFMVEKKMQNEGREAKVLSWFWLPIRHLQSHMDTWWFLAEWVSKYLTSIFETVTMTEVSLVILQSEENSSGKPCFIISTSTWNLQNWGFYQCTKLIRPLSLTTIFQEFQGYYNVLLPYTRENFLPMSPRAVRFSGNFSFGGETRHKALVLYPVLK